MRRDNRMVHNIDRKNRVGNVSWIFQYWVVDVTS
jgi:hypothetical protein